MDTQKILEMMTFKEQTCCKSCSGITKIIDPKTGDFYACKSCASTGTAPVPFCEADHE